MTGKTGDWITLNVGGKIFTTTRLTLTMTEPNSMLATMFDSDETKPWKNDTDESGAVLIDRSGDIFGLLLDYLRRGKLVLDNTVPVESVLLEAEYYNFENLLAQLKPIVDPRLFTDTRVLVPEDKLKRFTRKEIVCLIAGTPSGQVLRLQGIDYEGCDLSRLDLSLANLRLTNLRRANLSHCTLTDANLEEANLTDAILDYAVVCRVNMQSANAQGVSMQYVNMFGGNAPSFENRVRFRDCNLENAVLDNSHFGSADFSFCNLKKASLKDCKLYEAVFRSTNMEMCDLSRSNLSKGRFDLAKLTNIVLTGALNVPPCLLSENHIGTPRSIAYDAAHIT